MARPISEEELQLKRRARRRLVGAILLVAVMAVLLPMVLDSEPEPRGQKIDIHIPSPDSAELKGAPGKPESSSVPKPAPDPVARAEPPNPPAAKTEALPPPADAQSAAPPRVAATNAGEPAAVEKPKDSTKGATGAAAAPKGSAAAAGGTYVVQVAALADAAKAKALEKRMAGVGLKTYTEVVTTPSGEVTRVRAGPYATKEAAEKARSQLKKAGLDGKVVPK